MRTPVLQHGRRTDQSWLRFELQECSLREPSVEHLRQPRRLRGAAFNRAQAWRGKGPHRWQCREGLAGVFQLDVADLFQSFRGSHVLAELLQARHAWRAPRLAKPRRGRHRPKAVRARQEAQHAGVLREQPLGRREVQRVALRRRCGACGQGGQGVLDLRELGAEQLEGEGATAAEERIELQLLAALRAADRHGQPVQAQLDRLLVKPLLLLLVVARADAVRLADLDHVGLALVDVVVVAVLPEDIHALRAVWRRHHTCALGPLAQEEADVACRAARLPPRLPELRLFEVAAPPLRLLELGPDPVAVLDMPRLRPPPPRGHVPPPRRDHRLTLGQHDDGVDHDLLGQPVRGPPCLHHPPLLPRPRLAQGGLLHFPSELARGVQERRAHLGLLGARDGRQEARDVPRPNGLRQQPLALQGFDHAFHLFRQSLDLWSAELLLVFFQEVPTGHNIAIGDRRVYAVFELLLLELLAGLFDQLAIQLRVVPLNAHIHVEADLQLAHRGGEVLARRHRGVAHGDDAVAALPVEALRVGLRETCDVHVRRVFRQLNPQGPMLQHLHGEDGGMHRQPPEFSLRIRTFRRHAQLRL
mmetsp:Transcript_45396/g.145659  ORF Transcript_45396/g.145659 Transcript_45396/m.145659 type:complete len:587 (-) Transcript_45396:1739-3499(-)